MEFPNIKARKSDRFALSSAPMDAEARRVGLEILANKGLLHEVFEYFDPADVSAWRLDYAAFSLS